jgi:hypothetical protein
MISYENNITKTTLHYYIVRIVTYIFYPINIEVFSKLFSICKFIQIVKKIKSLNYLRENQFQILTIDYLSN